MIKIFYQQQHYLSDQVKNALDSIKTKTRDVAISLDTSKAQIYNLQIPIMDEESLSEATSLEVFGINLMKHQRI